MPVTTNFAIPYPDGTTSLIPLQDRFADIANAVDSALLNGLAGAPRQVTSDAQRATVFPAPVQGNLANRPDKGYIEVYLAAYDPSTNPGGAAVAGWYPLPGTILGSSYVNPAQVLPTTATAVTGLSAVAYCPGTPVKLTFEIFAYNAGSGASRKFVGQFFEDGIAIGTSRVWSDLFISSSTGISGNLTLFRTPTAGIHTYTVRVNADAASSVTIQESSVTVTAIAPKS
jgi:hypothetical protein